MKINQPLPKDETGRHWEEEKILYKWEEKSAYEARGEITGIQVATDGEEIKRIGFAYKHTFEEFRATVKDGAIVQIHPSNVWL